MPTLYEEWISNSRDSSGMVSDKFWKAYMPREKAIYEALLESKTSAFKTTIADFAKDYDLQVFEAVGFFDGISEALNEEFNAEDATEKTQIDVSFEFETLFRKMVDYKAKHLYQLPGWNNIMDADKQKVLIKEQQKSGMIVKDKKIGRNDPCPCESGKKYKKCCGFDE